MDSLAYAELYLTTAAIFRNFDLELFESGLEDITMTRNYSFGYTDNYTWGTKVKVTGILD